MSLQFEPERPSLGRLGLIALYEVFGGQTVSIANTMETARLEFMGSGRSAGEKAKFVSRVAAALIGWAVLAELFGEHSGHIDHPRQQTRAPIRRILRPIITHPGDKLLAAANLTACISIDAGNVPRRDDGRLNSLTA